MTTKDQLVSFRTTPEKVQTLDKIADRLTRTRSNLLQCLTDTAITLEEKGELDTFLLKHSQKPTTKKTTTSSR